MSANEFEENLSAEAALERLLGGVLRAADPAEAFAERRASADRGLDDAVGAIHEDGLRTAALLVVKLRFERLMAASTRASALFEEDPARFADLFRRYHAEVPSVSPMPADERISFEAWLVRVVSS